VTSKQEQQVDKKERNDHHHFWNDELRSLGIEPKRHNELNDDDDELEHLVDIIKLSMYQDYKTAYSMNGDNHKEEAESTITV
jgi:hypothetical protein